MYFAAVSVTLAFAHLVNATPLRVRGAQQTVPLTRHWNPIPAQGQVVDLVKQAQDRIHFLAGSSNSSGSISRREASTSATDIIFYETMSIGIGSPETYYDVLIDSGSSNTWVGANSAYTPTFTSHATGDTLSLHYGSNPCPAQCVTGIEYYDRVDLGSGLVINSQSIGVAQKAEGIDGFEGILGLGPDDLTEGTVQNTAEIPTVTDNLFSEGVISQAVVGIYFSPVTSDNEVDGELTFGGVDMSRTTSAVTYVAHTRTGNSEPYWGLDASISYGTKQLLSSTGIVDTGSPLVMISPDAFAAYKAAIPGAKINEYGYLQIPASSIAGMKPLNWKIGGTTFALSPTAQLFPQKLNSYIGGQSGSYYAVVSSIGSGAPFDFIIGKFMLERFYLVLDTTNARIGFATTANT